MSIPLVSTFIISAALFYGLSTGQDDTNSRDATVKGSAANITTFNTPYAYYDLERDPRQWLTSNYGSPGGSLTPFNGGIEAITVGLLIAIGIGVIGLPLIILLISMFLNNNSNSSFNFFPPAATTTVSGRKRRDLMPEILFPNLNPQLQVKMFDIFKQISAARDGYFGKSH